jgi:hypothetical protein
MRFSSYWLLWLMKTDAIPPPAHGSCRAADARSSRRHTPVLLTSPSTKALRLPRFKRASCGSAPLVETGARRGLGPQVCHSEEAAREPDLTSGDGFHLASGFAKPVLATAVTIAAANRRHADPGAERARPRPPVSRSPGTRLIRPCIGTVLGVR